MSSWQDARRIMLIQSFNQAQQEGKVWQWVFKRLLLHILWWILDLILIFPIRLSWRLSGLGRNDSGFVRFLKFVFILCLVYAAIVALFLALFGGKK